MNNKKNTTHNNDQAKRIEDNEDNERNEQKKIDTHTFEKWSHDVNDEQTRKRRERNNIRSEL